jgi:ArsR family metal-binding transcriptional regulator
MWLMRIRPDTIGRQIRTFECADCGQTTCLSVAIGPLSQT